MQNKRYMTDQDEMFELLCSISNANIPSVRRKLSKGDKISLRKATSFKEENNNFWIIDDPYIFKKLPGFDNLPLEAKLETIHKIFHLRNDPTREKRKKLFDSEGEKGCFEGDISLDYRILPFSTAVENKAGFCLERAILLQLSQQEKIDTFLVCGECDVFGVQGVGHAYNIILKDKKLLLIDVAPIKNKNKDYIPYIIPIYGIDLYGGDIILQPHIADIRKYSIFYVNEIREYFISH